MEEIKRYYYGLQKHKTLNELPYGTKKADYTITFVQPILGTMEGFYKMVVPGMILNRKHPGIRCVFAGMQLFDESLCQNDYNTVLKRGILKATDHLVLPFVSYDLTDVLIQAKEANPDIKFSYHIDYNYYDMPDSFTFVESYKSAEAFDIIERNISMVDRVFCSNANLSDFLYDHLKDKLTGSGTQIIYFPIMFDKHYISSLQESSRYRKREKFCIGIIAGRDHFSDVNFIRPVLKQFMAKHGEQSEIVMVGYNGVHKKTNYMKGIEFEHVPQVPFFDYYQTMIDLAFNVVLIPCRDNKFNVTSKNYTKWLEFTNIGVSVIMPDIAPYNKIVKHNSQGILCGSTDAWVDELTVLLNDRVKPEEIMKSAYFKAMDYNIDLTANLKLLEKILVI